MLKRWKFIIRECHKLLIMEPDFGWWYNRNWPHPMQSHDKWHWGVICSWHGHRWTLTVKNYCRHRCVKISNHWSYSTYCTLVFIKRKLNKSYFVQITVCFNLICPSSHSWTHFHGLERKWIGFHNWKSSCPLL